MSKKPKKSGRWFYRYYVVTSFRGSYWGAWNQLQEDDYDLPISGYQSATYWGRIQFKKFPKGEFPEDTIG